jgi:DNA-binding LacI/PurR family transcriptional regulator
MDDVARRAGVSRALVSLVLHDSPKVGPERRAAVLAAAADLGYSPHVLARQLASRTSTVLAVLVSNLHNPYFADVVEAVEAAARDAGLDMILSTGGRRPAGERRAVETMLGFRPAGLVLLSPVVPTAVLETASATTPVAVVERSVALAGVDTVTHDGHAGSRLAVEHLAALGHRDVVHLDGGRGAQSATRRRGYVEAMTALGLEPRVEPSEYTEEGGGASVGRLLAAGRPFTAVVAANDVNAIGAMTALEDAGLRVPEDVSVVGYDNTSLASLRHIGLTTVDQPRAELGRLAVEAVVGRLRDGRTTPVRHRLQPALVVRSTTAEPAEPAEPDAPAGVRRSGDRQP